MPRKDPGMPYDLAPMLKARFGQPDDCADLVNKYGTYNIQPTSDTENLFPLIAPGLPEQWKRMAAPFFFSKIHETARENGLFPKK